MLERVYQDAYKQATGDGEKHRAAHIAGLQAVWDQGKLFSEKHPVRNGVAKCFRTLGRWIEG